MDRDHVTPEQVLTRMRSQMNESEKMKLCRWRIDNNEQVALIDQVLNLHQELTALSNTNVKL
jgi:dephospho-CoA kinase